MVKIKSAAKVAEEEALLAQAKQVCAEQPRSTDYSDYNNSQRQLHDKGLEIREYINTTYPDYCEQHPALKTFRGSYGYSSDPETQEIQLCIQLARDNDDQHLTLMLLTMQEINTEMLYEAEKLCIKNPAPWWTAWSDELGPYPPES